MAEIALAASIIAIVKLSGEVVLLSYEYIRKVKRSRGEITALIDELTSLQQVLEMLKNHIRGNPDSLTIAVQTLGGEDGPLQGCDRDLGALRRTLELRGGIYGVLERLKWPIREGEIDGIKRRLERHKSLFLLVLTADQMSAAARRGGISLESTSDVDRDIRIHSEDPRTQEDTTYKGQKSFAQLWVFEIH